MTTKNIQDVVAEKVDVAVYNLLFAGLSIEQMDKIPKWLLENMDKNKEDVKTTLTQLVKEVKAGAYEEAIKLSDEIEMSEPDGGTKQWMAFKRFRNTMRDQLQSLKQTN